MEAYDARFPVCLEERPSSPRFHLLLRCLRRFSFGGIPAAVLFLDEGFGTLDQDLLDTVVTALEKLQSDNLAVGVISHVQELRTASEKADRPSG